MARTGRSEPGQLSTHGTTAAPEFRARGRRVGNDLGELFKGGPWDHPGQRWFSPGYRLPAGHGLRYTCNWTNPDPHPVGFGVTTDDEMCFIGGYFYPDEDDRIVTGPGCRPQGAGLLCFTP